MTHVSQVILIFVLFVSLQADSSVCGDNLVPLRGKKLFGPYPQNIILVTFAGRGGGEDGVYSLYKQIGICRSKGYGFSALSGLK